MRQGGVVKRIDKAAREPRKFKILSRRCECGEKVKFVDGWNRDRCNPYLRGLRYRCDCAGKTDKVEDAEHVWSGIMGLYPRREGG